MNWENGTVGRNGRKTIFDDYMKKGRSEPKSCLSMPQSDWVKELNNANMNGHNRKHCFLKKDRQSDIDMIFLRAKKNKAPEPGSYEPKQFKMTGFATDKTN